MDGDVEKIKTCLEVFNNMEYANEKTSDVINNWLANHKKFDCWINGRYEAGKNPVYVKRECRGTFFEVADGKNCVDAALESSMKALDAWTGLNAAQRADALRRGATDIGAKLHLISEFNKTSSKQECLLLAEYFKYYADWPLLVDDYKNWKPSGVVLLVLSRQCSLQGLTMAVAPALAAGCSVIMKPSTKSLYTAYLLADLMSGHVPEGLLNVVPGGKEVVHSFLAKDTISKVVFCGRVATAEAIRQRNPGKSFSFLNPGKTSAIVLETSDLDSVIHKLLKETWNGSSFWAVSNVVVQESISQAFMDKMKVKLKTFLMEMDRSDRFKDEAIKEKLKEVVADAKRQGGVVETAAGSTSGDHIGWLPTVLFECQPKVVDPDLLVMTVVTCRTAREAVALVNNSPYTLATSVWTDLSAEACEVADLLRSGTVWINCHGVTSAAVPLQPFGVSGDGSYGGRDGVLEFMYRVSQPSTVATKPMPITTEKVYSASKFVSDAQNAFAKWHADKNRKKCLLDVAKALEADKDLQVLSAVVQYWAAQCGKQSLFTDTPTSKESLVTQWKRPIGVIAVFLNDETHAVHNFVSLAAQLASSGNVGIFATTAIKAVSVVAEMFRKAFPSHVLTVVGSDEAKSLATDPNVQALWLCNEGSHPAHQVQTWRLESSKHMKRIFLTPSVIPRCTNLYMKECFRNKVVWFTKSSHFP